MIPEAPAGTTRQDIEYDIFLADLDRIVTERDRINVAILAKYVAILAYNGG